MSMKMQALEQYFSTFVPCHTTLYSPPLASNTGNNDITLLLDWVARCNTQKPLRISRYKRLTFLSEKYKLGHFALSQVSYCCLLRCIAGFAARQWWSGDPWLHSEAISSTYCGRNTTSWEILLKMQSFPFKQVSWSAPESTHTQCSLSLLWAVPWPAVSNKKVIPFGNTSQQCAFAYSCNLVLGY